MSDEEVFDVDDLLDSEMIAINRTMSQVQTGQAREQSAVQREIRERLAEIGFVAKVAIREMPDQQHLPKDDRIKIPSVEIIGRCEPLADGFDHEKMGHEVRSDIRGLNPDGNVQKTQVSGGFSPSKSGLILPKQ